MSASAEKSAADLLATPVQFIRGVGPQRAELLARLGLRRALDVLFFFPRDYQDLTDLRSIADLEEEKLLSVQGVVEETELRSTQPGRSLLGVLIRQGSLYLRALWFNQPFMKEKFQAGQEVLLSGKAVLRGGRWEMVHPRVQWVDPEEGPPAAAMLPVYSLTQGLNQGQLRAVVRSVLDLCVDALEETFPQAFLDAHSLLPLRLALPQIHFPANPEALAQARRRFVYQELLVLQLALALRRQQYQSRQAPPLELSAKIDARIRRLLTFDLTKGQEQAVAEVTADMARAVPMNRLLQGDVGSGKTIVAVYAMLLAAAHGYQAAIMAPTEILARQHFRTLNELLRESQLHIGLLTGGLTGKQREETLTRLASGDIDLIVGTQAIVHAEAQFARLGLVVIDEQHKFGVRQRAFLKRANPHYLVMTATPIPRTIAMTLFGDLDVSSIADAPPGRQKVHTYQPTEEDEPKWWEFFRKKLREGRQGYVIVPLVESRGRTSEGDDVDDPAVGSEENQAGEDADQSHVASVEETFERLVHSELEAFRVGLVHGRMTAAEKEAVMEEFRAGKLQVIVATSVVEVGIDVPNATMMTILDAQRFGLAQLHQLRGRIGRGTHPGYCAVVSKASSDVAARRLDAFLKSTDGFQLAELDFRLRGPGDLLGIRQHGLPPLRIADLQTDAAVLEEARADAQQLVAEDPGLGGEQHTRLRKMVLSRYGKALDLGDVG